MIRRILALVLSFSLATPAFAGVSQDPEQVMASVDEYIRDYAQTPKEADPAYKQAQAAYYSQAIAIQLGTLEPEDYNLFLFAVLSRYINRPQEREALFEFFKATRVEFAADLANTAKLEQGVAPYLNPADWSWYTWGALAAGVVITRGMLRGPLRNARFVQSLNRMQGQAAALKNAGWKGAGWKSIAGRAGLFATHPATIATTLGTVAGGLAEYGVAASKTYRLDPLVVLSVVQAQIGCSLSYRGLDIDERVTKASADEASMRADYDAIKKDIESIKGEAELLTKQFASLDNIRTEDPELQKAMKKIPVNLPEKYSNLQDFRKTLIKDGASVNGQCRQISLTNLIVSLNKRAEDLKTFHEILIPAENAPAAPAVTAPAAPAEASPQP